MTPESQLKPQDSDVDLSDAIEQLRIKKGIPKSLVDRLVHQESGGSESAVSPKGAQGSFQVMPATFDQYNRKVGGKLNRDNPLDRAYVGLSLLQDNYKQFKNYAKNDQHNWGMALAGYHAGPNNVMRDLRKGGNGIPDTNDGLINTRDYVYDIMSGMKPEEAPKVDAQEPAVATAGMVGEQPKLKTPKVTSEVVDPSERKLEPIKFQPADNSELNKLARGVQGLSEQAAMQGMQLPKTHPNLVGKRVEAKFDHPPTAEELDGVLLEQLGKGYGALAQQFRDETGVSLTANNVSVDKQPDGSYVAHARPSQGFVDAVNAYALGGRGAYEATLNSQTAGKAAIARDVNQELKRGQGVAQDLGQAGVREVARNAQFMQNAADIARGRAPEDDPNARAIARAEQSIPAQTTNTGALAEIPLSAAGAITRAEALGGTAGFPASAAIESAQAGPEAAYKSAIMTAPMLAAGPIAESIGANEMSPIARQVATRGIAGAGMAVPAVASGASPAEVGKAFIEGAAFPTGKRGEAERPIELGIEKAPIAGVQGRGALDAERILAEREARVRPPTQPEDIPVTPTSMPERRGPDRMTNEEYQAKVKGVAGTSREQLGTIGTPSKGAQEAQAASTPSEGGVAKSDKAIADQSFRHLNENGLRDIPREPIFLTLDLSQDRGIGSTEVELSPETRTKQTSFIVFPNADGKTGWAYSNPRGGTPESARQAGFPDRSQGRYAVLGEGGKWIVGKESVPAEAPPKVEGGVPVAQETVSTSTREAKKAAEQQQRKEFNRLADEEYEAREKPERDREAFRDTPEYLAAERKVEQTPAFQKIGDRMLKTEIESELRELHVKLDEIVKRQMERDGTLSAAAPQEAPKGETAKPATAPKTAEPLATPDIESQIQDRIKAEIPDHAPEFVRAAKERAIRRELQPPEEAKLGKQAGAAKLPQEEFDRLVSKGWDFYDQKIKPTFEEWANKMREAFGKSVDPHLRGIYGQLSTRDTTGIAQRVEQLRRETLERTEARRGTGISSKDSVERGRQMLAEGKSPEQAVEDFKRTGAVSSDAMALVRARHEELARAANRAFDAGRQSLNDPAFKAAEQARQDYWEQSVKPMQTEWAKTGMAQQGETSIDTGTFYGLYRAFKDQTGREMTAKEETAAKRLTGKVADTEQGVKTAQQNLVEQLNRAAGIKDLPSDVQGAIRKLIDQSRREARTEKRQQTRKSLDDEAAVIKQNIAAAFQKIKSQTGVQPLGLARLDPEGVISKEVLKYARNRAKAGLTDAAQLIDDVHGMVSEFTDVTKREVAEALSGMGVPKRTVTKTEWAKVKRNIQKGLKAEDQQTDQGELRGRVSGGTISPEDAKIIWRHTVDNYIDKGVEFGDAVQSVAKDLGTTPEKIRRALGSQPKVKPLTDEVYRRMSARRQARAQAESWIKTVDQSPLTKALKGARDAFFNIATFGHGTVGAVTHAGENIFHPTRWADYIRNVGRTFKGAYNSAAHERYMQDLVNDPNYTVARRAGLHNEPGKFYDDYQNTQMQKLFGAVGKIGNRGFDALKTMRQDFFNSQWNKLKDEQKTPEMAKAIADIANHATGAIRTKIPGSELARGIFFAPPLEASRWARLFGDPARALNTFSNWKKATPSEKYFAKQVAKNHAEFLATYTAALALNAGLLKATGSDDKVNFTDPSKSDWLRFKIGGRVIEPTGGIISTIDFLGKLGMAAVGRKRPDETRYQTIGKAGAQYIRGKLAPGMGTAVDIATQADYSGRPLPFSSDKDTEEKPRYSWAEYAGTKAPIPASEGIRDFFHTMREQGVPLTTTREIISAALHNPSAVGKAATIGTISGGTGIRIGEDFSNPQKDTEREERINRQDFKERLIGQLREGRQVDLNSLVGSDRISKSDKKAIEKQSAMTPFQSTFENAFPNQALDRYERLVRLKDPRASEVQDIMTKKGWALTHSDSLTQKQKDDFQVRLDALGITPVNPQKKQSSKFMPSFKARFQQQLGVP